MSPLLLCLWGVEPAVAANRRTPVVEAVERATPAVVTVQVEVETHNPFAFFGSQVAASEGSGVVIRSEGLVLTNAHVVDGARSIVVRTTDGRARPARVMAMEPDLDLAVLQVEGAVNLPTATLGDSSDLMLGETVIAIGNPLGLGLTVSTGVVSSVARDVEVRPGLHQSFVQTDAAINPGNSGGALVDINGALIGINTAIRQDAEGIGFAIPVNRAMKIAADLVHFGTVRAPWLGIDVEDVDMRSALRGAVLVRSVAHEGPGHRAGLQRGDLIIEVDGHTVTSRADLNGRLAERSPGEVLDVTVVRENRYATIAIETTSVPEDTGIRLIRDHLGIEVAATETGVAVVRAAADGLWARSSLRVGDVIVAIDGAAIGSVAEAHEALRRVRSQHRASALITVRRGRHQGHVELSLG